MPYVYALLRNKAWIAHLLGLASLTGAEISQGATNPVLLAAVTAMTSVFHLCDALVKVKTPQLRINIPSPSQDPMAPQWQEAAPLLRNAAGDIIVEP